MDSSELIWQLRHRRRKLGMRQSDLAEKMGTSQSHICDIEKGKHAPSTRSLLAYAEVVGLQVILIPTYDPEQLNVGPRE